MQLNLTAFTLLSLTIIAAADNCKKGLDYCGRGLLNKGNYYATITNVLAAASQPTDGAHVPDSLFYCRDKDGNIDFQVFCGKGCKDNGSGNSDECN